jgi:hypothetical protein
MPKAKKAQDRVEVEPGADKQLANILKKALNTPPPCRRADDPSTRSHNSLIRRALTRRWWTSDLVQANGSASSL